MGFFHQDPSGVAVERAIFELRSGRPVWLQDAQRGATLQLRAAELAAMPHGSTSQEKLIGAMVPADAAEYLPQWLRAEEREHPLQATVDATELSALQLLKHAELLPLALVSAIVTQEADMPWLRVTAEAVEWYRHHIAESLTEIAKARLPLKMAQQTELRVFRTGSGGGQEHLALIIGDALAQEAPLVRVHSSCVTGDILGSLRCDCGDQLQLAIQAMAAQGGGVLCYLNQEGRGIGIGNKIRAYALQEQGQDTRQANETLGFAGDERQFLLAAAMLRALGIGRIRLMTNNPKKVNDLTALGIHVVERVAVQAPAHEHNHAYLSAKAERFGHLL